MYVHSVFDLKVCPSFPETAIGYRTRKICCSQDQSLQSVNVETIFSEDESVCQRQAKQNLDVETVYSPVALLNN